MSIEWRPVPGYEGLYEVSGDGRVSSVARLDTMGRPVGGRDLTPHPDRAGYMIVHLSGGSRQHRRHVKVHRLVAAAFCGHSDLEVRHLDGNPANNCAENLAYGTARQNAADRARHCTSGRGIANNKARLTASTVRAIRERYAAGGVTQCQLAREYGVTQAHISAIIRSQSWGWLAA